MINMKKVLLFFLLLVNFTVLSQTTKGLKKRFLGTYAGFISSYELKTPTPIFVDSVEIKITIEKEQISFSIGTHQYSGSYKLLLETKKYIVLECTIENQMATERIMVYKRGKHLSRDGLFPQPNAELFKIKQTKNHQ